MLGKVNIGKKCSFCMDVTEAGGKWKEHMGDLKKNLLALELTMKELLEKAPFTDKNRRKGLRILHGGWFGSTRRQLYKMKNNFDYVKESIGTLVVGLDKVHSKISRAQNQWTAEQLNSHVANITGALSRGGQFDKALRNKEYGQISQAELHAVLTSIDGLLVVIDSTSGTAEKLA